MTSTLRPRAPMQSTLDYLQQAKLVRMKALCAEYVTLLNGQTVEVTSWKGTLLEQLSPTELIMAMTSVEFAIRDHRRVLNARNAFWADLGLEQFFK